MPYALFNHVLHRLPYSYVAEQAMAVLVPPLHLLHAVLVGTADGGDFVAMGESRPREGKAHVACCAEDLCSQGRLAG